MSRRKRTIINLVFNYLSFILVVISAIVLVPLYLAYIPTRLYGAWLAAANVLSWISLADPGFSTILMQRIALAYGGQNTKEVHALIAAGISLAIATGALILFAGILVAGHLGAWLNLAEADMSNALTQAFVVGVFGAALTVVSYSITTINQGLQSSTIIGLVYVLANVAAIGATVWLLMHGHGVLSIAIAMVVRGGLLLVGNAFYLVSRLRSDLRGFQMSATKFREILGLSGFQYLSQVGNVLNTQIEAFAVARFLGAEIVPPYILTRRGPDTARVLAERPSTAFMPAVAHAYGEGQLDVAKAVLLRLNRMVIWVAGLLVGGFWVLNEDFVRLWIGSGMYAGWTINTIVCAGMLTSIVARNFLNLCQALGNFRGSNVAIFVESIICAAGTVLGVKYFGLVGVALAPVLAACCVSLWYFPRSFAKFRGMQHNVLQEIGQSVLEAVGAAIIPVVVIWHSNPEGWYAFSGAVLEFVLLYGCNLYLTSKDFRVETRGLLRLLRL